MRDSTISYNFNFYDRLPHNKVNNIDYDEIEYDQDDFITTNDDLDIVQDYEEVEIDENFDEDELEDID